MLGTRMQVLITMMGLSIWGTFNSIWAMIRRYDYVPERVYILTPETDIARAEIAVKMIRILLEEHNTKPDVQLVKIKGYDVKEVVTRVRNIAEEEKAKGNQIALDVTPGRKAVVLGSVFAGWGRKSFDHIFYLYLESLLNANRPHILIPMSIQHPHDIITEAG
jgi:hypothetical protein